MKNAVIVGGLILAAGVAWYAWPKAGAGAGGPGMMGGTPEVSVVTIKTEPVTFTKDLPGRTSAFRVAEIRPQVSGIVVKRMFEEGGLVTEGQQLYQIDPAPYQASYNSALADLQKAEANVKSVASKADRYARLVEIGGISKQDMDDATSSLAQAKASVAMARAAVATAKINLDYTKVMSPISGRIGESKVTEGALVNANQADALAVVQQLDKIYVDVSQSSKEAMALRKQRETVAHSDDSAADKDAAVVHLLVDGKEVGEPGTLKFSDITVSKDTGTVMLRALFPNPNLDILPGLFVQARLEQWKDANAILVSQKSVNRQADGSVSVWIVGPDGKALIRPISVTEVIGDKWLVTNGLAAGDKVVLEGGMKLRQPGTPVKAVEAGAPVAGQLAATPHAPAH